MKKIHLQKCPFAIFYVLFSIIEVSLSQTWSHNENCWTYDGSGNLITITDTVGRNINFTYNANSRIIRIADPIGRVIGYEYDANENLIRVTDANNESTTFEYDGTHRLTKIVLPKGNTLIENIYDDQDRVMSQINGRGFTTTFDYNTPNTGETTITDPLGHTTIHTHDDAYRLTQVTDANWNTTQYTYDENNNRTSVTDKNGNVTSYAYDSVGNVISKTDAPGNVTTIVYDSNNNPIQRTDVSGNNTTYTYDANGNLVSTTDPLGNVSSITYNSHGQPLAQTDANGHVTTYGYDSEGNLTQIINALGNITTFNYDGAGRKTSSTDANGYTKSFTYDNNDNLLRVTDPVGGVTAYIYDANENRTSVTDPRGNTTFYSYDENDLLTAITDSLGNVTTYSYDEVDNKVSIQDTRGNAAQHTYDGVGNLIQTRDALNNITSFTYDENGNLLTKINPLGRTTTFSYDSLDRLVQTIDPSGNTTQLTTITYPDATTVSFSHDANDNRIGMVDKYGAYSYQYDELNRLTRYPDVFGKIISYAYDGAGNRTSLTYPDGKVVNYTYGPLNRMSTATDWLGGITSYNYDAGGNLTNIANPNGTTVTYGYDNADRLLSLTNAKSDVSVISSYNYTLDGVGNRTQVTRNEPLSPILTSAAITYNYDNDSRLLSSTGTTYTYDANGNMTSKGSDTYNYDYEDRLIQTSIGGVTTQYQYDGLGNRIAKIQDDVTTRYVLDVNGSLSQVLAETDGSGAITSYYVYGLGLISKITPSNTASYYHYDFRGSAIALTDQSGNITDKYAYEPFGKLANSDGGTDNPFKYVGRYGVMDEGNGLNFIRARYYAPELGRFITKDPLTGNDRDGQSLDRYVYALNNPIVLIDISGFSAREGLVHFNNLGSSDEIHDSLFQLSEFSFLTAGSTPKLIEEKKKKKSNAGKEALKNVGWEIIDLGTGICYLFWAGAILPSLTITDPSWSMRASTSGHFAISGLDKINDAGIDSKLAFTNVYRYIIGQEAKTTMSRKEGPFGFMTDIFDINAAASIGGLF